MEQRPLCCSCTALVLRSNVLTVLDLDEVSVKSENAEIFGSMLSREGGSVGDSWWCC